MDSEYLEGNVREARWLQWHRATFTGPADHAHCLICWSVISALSPNGYRSGSVWLDEYCHQRFIAPVAGGTGMADQDPPTT